MAFEEIKCVKPSAAKARAVSPNGIAVTSRVVGNRGGVVSRYIKLTIGAVLARGIGMTREEHQVRLLFGSGADEGKVRVVGPLNPGGPFKARQGKSGVYTLTINQRSAEGRFALDFPAFAIDRIEAVRPENGQSPHFVFLASAEMLAVDG